MCKTNATTPAEEKECEAIIKLLENFSRDLEDGQLDFFRKTFTDDAVLRPPPAIAGDMAITPLSEIEKQYKTMDLDRRWLKDLRFLYIELKGEDEAFVTSHVGKPLEPDTIWFDDEMVKLDRGWRIKERRVSETVGEPGTRRWFKSYY